MKKIFYLAAVCSVLFILPLHANKALWHYVSLPLIEGAGIYASVASLTDDNSTGTTTAASITTLSLLGANAALGMVAMFGGTEAYDKLRGVHRILGFAITAAGVWLSVSSSVDGVKTPARIASYAYTGMSVVPIIMFSF